MSVVTCSIYDWVYHLMIFVKLFSKHGNGILCPIWKCVYMKLHFLNVIHLSSKLVYSTSRIIKMDVCYSGDENVSAIKIVVFHKNVILYSTMAQCYSTMYNLNTSVCIWIIPVFWCPLFRLCLFKIRMLLS